MAKAIHWPAKYLAEILAEDDAAIHCAFRIGRLYYDEPYWAPDEVVDIRVNHEIVRQAKIVGSLKCYRIKTLSSEDLRKQKTDLQTIPAVIRYLRETYQQPGLDEETEVTIVYYQNLPLAEADSLL